MTGSLAQRHWSLPSVYSESLEADARLMPRDSSDIAQKAEEPVRGRLPGSVPEKREYSDGASGLRISTKTKGKQVKRRSVSFEEDLQDLIAGNASGGRGRGFIVSSWQKGCFRLL